MSTSQSLREIVPWTCNCHRATGNNRCGFYVVAVESVFT